MWLKKKGEDPKTALKKLTEDETPSEAAGLLAWGSVAVGAVLFAYIAFAFAPAERRSIEFGRDVETTASIRPTKPPGSVTTVGVGGQGNGIITGSIGTGPAPVAQRDLDVIRQDLQALRRSIATTNAINDELARRIAALETLATKLSEAPPRAEAPVAPPPAQVSQAPAEPPTPVPAPPARVIPLPSAQPQAEPIPLPSKPMAEAARPSEPVHQVSRPLPGATFAPIVSPMFAGISAPPVEAEDQTVTGSIPPQPVAIPRPAPVRAAPAEVASPGQIAPTAITPEQASKSDFGIDLGGFKSMQQLRQAWQAFHARNAEVIGAVGPVVRIEENNDGTMDLRLIAGPYGNALDAIRHCAKMKLQGATCVPTLFVGQSLAMQ